MGYWLVLRVCNVDSNVSWSIPTFKRRAIFFVIVSYKTTDRAH